MIPPTLARIADAAGWTPATVLDLLGDWIVETGRLEEVAAHLKRIASEERDGNGDAS